LQERATPQLQTKAMETIKVERDMLQLQLKQEGDKFLAFKKKVNKIVAQCATLTINKHKTKNDHAKSRRANQKVET